MVIALLELNLYLCYVRTTGHPVCVGEGACALLIKFSLLLSLSLPLIFVTATANYLLPCTYRKLVLIR